MPGTPYGYVADAEYTLRQTVTIQLARKYDVARPNAEQQLQNLLASVMAAGIQNGELRADSTLQALADWFFMKTQQMGGNTDYVMVREGRRQVTAYMPEP